MRISNLIVRTATLGLFAFTVLALSTKTGAANGGDPTMPTGSIDADEDDSERSEDGIGTGPIVADLDSGKGYQVTLPTPSLLLVTGTITGSGSVNVQDLGDGNSLVSLYGDMSFQLSFSQLSNQGIQVADPVGDTVGQMFLSGSKMYFTQKAL